MRGWPGKGLLLLVSLSLALVVGEVALRLAGYSALYDVYSKPDLLWRHDDLLGWSHEPGGRGRYRGPRPFPIEFDTAIEINSLGLRGPELAPRREGERRVLVLGDSVVAGFEVEQSETFVARLEVALRRRLDRPVSVVNGGVRGYGTDQSLLWFRERGRTLEPDLVVLVFSQNDFEDNVTLHRPKRPFGKGAFALRPGGELELVGVPVRRYSLCSSWVLDGSSRPTRIDGPLSRASCLLETELGDHSALFTFVVTALGRMPSLVHSLKGAADRAAAVGPSYASLPFWPRPALADEPEEGPGARARLADALTTALIQDLAREVRSGGARFLLMGDPKHLKRLDLRALFAEGIEPHAVVLSPWISPSRIHFRNDAHLNALGHGIYAQGLTPLVEAELRALDDAGG